MRYWLVDDQEIYPLIGEDGFRRLVAAFYRQVPQDELLGPMYPRHDLAGAEERLREFLIFRFGGPQRYLETRGIRGCACGTDRLRSIKARATAGFS